MVVPCMCMLSCRFRNSFIFKRVRNPLLLEVFKRLLHKVTLTVIHKVVQMSCYYILPTFRNTLMHDALCTGGIRCEKSTAFLKSEGIEDVYHLKGGILKYLEVIAREASTWHGECFVFDQRVSVGHGLAQGTHLLCHACRMPVSPRDIQSPLYEPGVSCPACHAERTDAQREAYRERHRQEALASAQGRAHVGAVLPDQAQASR